ncbi:MAG: hypothetical protein M0017_13690 [Desulfobacteraceae bacterium]|nr:hypothetical protein [Desulfobacteraceae bacterium]
MPNRKKNPGKRNTAVNGGSLHASRLKPLPLQQEFESLRRFAEGYGLTAEKLAMMARSLERYPVGEKKGVLESLRSLAEKRRIPHGRLTRIAETMAYEPELLQQIELIRKMPPESGRRPPTGARRGPLPAAASTPNAAAMTKSPVKLQYHDALMERKIDK